MVEEKEYGLRILILFLLHLWLCPSNNSGTQVQFVITPENNTVNWDAIYESGSNGNNSFKSGFEFDSKTVKGNEKSLSDFLINNSSTQPLTEANLNTLSDNISTSTPSLTEGLALPQLILIVGAEPGLNLTMLIAVKKLSYINKVWLNHPYF